MQEIDAPFFEIPSYHDYLSPRLARHLLAKARPIAAVPGLSHPGERGDYETDKALQFLSCLYEKIKPELKAILQQRVIDRKFIDERVSACFEFNKSLGREITASDYQTVLGLKDSQGRVVFGPLSSQYCQRDSTRPIAEIPPHLQGPHVTLFGPPDSAKLAINAMNSYHRKLKDEPAIVSELLADSQVSPFWGADDEDSKTPLRSDLNSAGENLTACFAGSLKVDSYNLAADHLAMPIKRFPGLALPSSFMFLNANPLPLHLYDFALHLFHNHKNARALTFYVPKLENEEEARYIHLMVKEAEALIKKMNPQYQEGTIRLMIVLENPRAILRVHEIMDALHPYFVGASLGWHDYLASTARLFKEDGHYRIPVKADPNIVIKYIKASHQLLADVVGSRGGVKVGGMYGILPQTTELRSSSFQVTMKGFIKDVLTQLNRDLTGFWVAHPDFIRIGIAFVRAWEMKKQGDSAPLSILVQALLVQEHHAEMDAFVEALSSGKNFSELDPSDPGYVRSLLVADIKESDFIANHHPDEIRYNVFQSLQYLADWLSGNGCVALPALIDGVPVRVMDDLATAERSRWEVWHELHHGRISREDFLQIVQEELHFIRKDLSNAHKIVQVKWNARTAKWYPVALQIMVKLMTDPLPAEFATELLMPFTVSEIRQAQDPWQVMQSLDPKKYVVESRVQRFLDCFDVCGCRRFAETLSQGVTADPEVARGLVFSFSKQEIIDAAKFHGEIGEAKVGLDTFAVGEQALVFSESEALRRSLQEAGVEYLNKFKMKFLVSAKGKDGKELLSILGSRMNNSHEHELENAKEALWLISENRLQQKSLDRLFKKIESLKAKYQINAASISLLESDHIQSLSLGGINSSSMFEIASLSKTIASAFAMNYFEKKRIPLTTSVNQLLAQTKSTFRIEAGTQGGRSSDPPQLADDVCVEHLLSHSALNMHYVNGIPLDQVMPGVGELIGGNSIYGYDKVVAVHQPGTQFQYSGGGFLVLEHLIESLEQKSISEVTESFLQELGLIDFSFSSKDVPGKTIVNGYFDNGKSVPGGRLMFPAFAAGAVASSRTVAQFLQKLAVAFQDPEGVPGISHDAAVRMLYGTDKGCRQFMGCLMGLGVFVAEAGLNKIMLHQGSNEGFRAIYVHCFSGPDRGRGLVVLCNADHRGVFFNSEVTQEILQAFDFQGVEFRKFQMSLSESFDPSQVSQEQIVNQGYKKLIFDAFIPTLPEKILGVRPRDPLANFNLLTAAEIISVSNQRFARAENLISEFLPAFDPELFGQQGKIMDSWESVRHNPESCDFMVLNLKQSSAARYVYLSTQFHDGNHPQLVRILCVQAGAPEDDHWQELLPLTPMSGHSWKKIKLSQKTPAATPVVKFIKIEMYPDGGLTRVGLYQDLPEEEVSTFSEIEKAGCVRFKQAIPPVAKALSIRYQPTAEEILKNLKSVQRAGLPVNLASTALGAELVSATNEHYGPAIQLLSPFPPINMFDGIESARSREPGHYEEVIVRLAKASRLQELVFNFKYFVNNNPLYLSVDGLCHGSNEDGLSAEWISLVEKTNVKAFAGNIKKFQVESDRVVSQLRVKTLPDGGINRLSVYAKK